MTKRKRPCEEPEYKCLCKQSDDPYRSALIRSFFKEESDGTLTPITPEQFMGCVAGGWHRDECDAVFHLNGDIEIIDTIRPPRVGELSHPIYFVHCPSGSTMHPQHYMIVYNHCMELKAQFYARWTEILAIHDPVEQEIAGAAIGPDMIRLQRYLQHIGESIMFDRVRSLQEPCPEIIRPSRIMRKEGMD